MEHTVSTHPLQTKVWAEFRKKWGNEVVETPYGFITLHKVPHTNLKIGAFIRGPQPSKETIKYLKDYGQKNSVIFIKLEPFVEIDDKIIKNLKKWGLIPGKTLFTPTTFWIDLTKSEEELLKSFSSKTRYNIKLAQRNDVEVVEDSSDEGFEEFLKLHMQTSKRQGFYSHTEKYHRLLWETLRKTGIAHLLFAKYRGEIMVSWMLFIYDGFLYYPYGASSEKYKHVMANNLIMWEAIKFGKKNNLKTFDLWGREEGKGFTRFKEGYNPQVVEFLGTWDLVINKPIYYLYRFAEIIRWFILRTKAKIFK